MTLSLIPTRTPHSQTWTYYEGEWREGNIALMGPRTHGAWMASTVFDGARRFEGRTPDLELHMARVNRSALAMSLKPEVSVAQWMALAQDGMARFPPNAALYIRPMYWADSGFGGGVMSDPESTRWCLCIYESPMPPPTGAAITLSPFRRPSAEVAVVEAKAGCLYPNGARALREAYQRGFGNCLMRDMEGNIAELGNANVFMVRDGQIFTPAATGAFLDGITRQRVIDLLREDGVKVDEARLSYEDFMAADEIFSTGNFQKIAPIIRIEDRELSIGPIFRRARALYWAYAHAG